MAHIFLNGLLLVIAGLLSGSTALSEKDSEESAGPTLTQEACGNRYYETHFPIDSRLFEHPWLVRFGYERGGNVSYIFQGLLIHEKFVLTTVHVAKFEDYGQLTYARLGEHNSLKAPDCEEESVGKIRCAPELQDILIDAVIVHPGYNQFQQSDNIALVKLRTRADVNGISVAPICLNRMLNLETPFLLIASWCGRRDTGISVIPKQYHMMKITPQDCKDRMPGYTISLSNGMFCIVFAQRHTNPPVEPTQEPNLRGGNGAPIFTVGAENKIYLIGLLSYGPRYPAKLHQPYIVTPVAPYNDWLSETIHSDLEKESYKTLA